MTGFSWDWGFVWSLIPGLLEGLWVTVQATAAGSVLALLLGFVWCVLGLANIPVVSSISKLMVNFFRGTPLLVQLYFLFYVLPGFGLRLPAFVAGCIGLGLHNGAYMSEALRAGVEAIPWGQWEACYALGVSRRWTLGRIIFPQALRTAVPMLGNYVVVMFKEAAQLSTITVIEVLGKATNIGFEHFRFIEPMTMAGFLYFIVSYISARMITRLEDHLAAKT